MDECPTLEELREAVSRAVAARGFTQVAMEVGVGSATLKSFGDGRGLVPKTQRKLSVWHRTAMHGQEEDEDAGAAEPASAAEEPRPEPEAGPSVVQLREAAARAVDDASLRRVAREIDVSPKALKGFLLGSRLYKPFRKRILAWYARRIAAGEIRLAPSLNDASASVTLLLREVEETLGPERAAALRADLAQQLALGWEGMEGAGEAVQGVRTVFRRKFPVRRKLSYLIDRSK